VLRLNALTKFKRQSTKSDRNCTFRGSNRPTAQIPSTALNVQLFLENEMQELSLDSKNLEPKMRCFITESELELSFADYIF
jgi:hypothetical protein